MAKSFDPSLVDAELRLRGRVVGPLLSFSSPSAFRRAQWLLDHAPLGKGGKGLACQETTLPRPKDGSPLRLLVYRSSSSPGRTGRSASPKDGAAGLLWLHGGGYAIGAPELDRAFYEQFAAAADCVIVAPDYRLSIREPYPAALDDSYAALVWMKDNAKALGIRDDQLFVGGDSAGGGLTAATTLLARDRGEVRVAFQLPLYPMIDDRMNLPSAVGNDAPVWSSRANEVAWRLYLGELFGTDRVPKYAAPSRETDFAGLPPTFTFVGGLEPFRDETRTYVANLRQAGVPVELHEYPGCYHAFEQMCPEAAVSRQAVAAMTEAFRKAVEGCFAEQPAARRCAP